MVFLGIVGCLAKTSLAPVTLKIYPILEQGIILSSGETPPEKFQRVLRPKDMIAKSALCLAFGLRSALAERLYFKEHPNKNPNAYAPIPTVSTNVRDPTWHLGMASAFPLGQDYQTVFG